MCLCITQRAFLVDHVYLNEYNAASVLRKFKDQNNLCKWQRTINAMKAMIKEKKKKQP